MAFHLCNHVAQTIPISELITIENAMQLLSVSRSTIYRLIKAKQLPKPIIINNRIRGWRADDFESFIQSLK